MIDLTATQEDDVAPPSNRKQTHTHTREHSDFRAPTSTSSMRKTSSEAQTRTHTHTHTHQETVTPVESWSIQDVVKWLEKSGLRKFVTTFKANEIDGSSMNLLRLVEVSNDPVHLEVWNNLGVTEVADKMMLKTEMNKLFR